MEFIDKLYDLKSTVIDFYENKFQSQNNCFNDLKQQAIDNFNTLGIPNIKSEDWKYTNIAFLNRTPLKVYDNNSNELDLSNLNLNDESVNLIVIVNGELSEKYSCFNLQEGIELLTYDDINENKDSSITNKIGKISNNLHPFTAINTALFEKGIILKIDDNINVENPFHVIYVNDATENYIHNYRKLIIAGDNSNMKIIESHISIGDNLSLNNNVGEIFVGKNANVEFNFLQNNNENDVLISSNYIHQSKDSIFTSFTFSLSGKLTRNYLSSVLDDENCNTNYYGVFVPNGNEVMDNHTLVNHAKPHCLSNENYRGIIAGKATGVFNGKIYVAKDAQKTNAYQSNKNILLSNTAVINSKPELEIYADDVKCSHGATSGAIDAESLFYLRARGLDFDAAQTLLLNAFAGEITDKITIPEFKSKVEHLIVQKLTI